MCARGGPKHGRGRSPSSRGVAGAKSEGIVSDVAEVLPLSTERKGRLTAVDLAKPLEPQRWTSEWLGIAPGRPTVMCGEGGSRKGWLSMAMLLFGAAGLQLFGHSMMADMSGIYLDWEQTLRMTRERFQLLSAGAGIDLVSLGDRLCYEWCSVKSLADDKCRETLCRHVDGMHVAVIDSARASSRGVKENTEEASAVGDNLTMVSEKTGCAFVLLDHTGKPDLTGARQRTHMLRGHSSKKDISSTLLVLSSSKGKPTLVTTERCQVKPQELWAGDFQFTLERTQHGVRLVDVPILGPVTQDEWDVNKTKVYEYIVKSPGIAGNIPIARKLSLGDQLVRTLVQTLVDEGLVVREKRPGKGQGVQLFATSHFSADTEPF